MAATILGSAMPGIDATAVNVALPVLQRELHAGADATQWVVEGYALFLSAFILVGGSLGDRLGRRRMFLAGIVVFAVASLACALSAQASQLIAGRCIQGIGGALLVPESLALITASFDRTHRGAAIGTWSGFLAATMAIGPLLGGWLVQAVSWRAVFVINVPIAAIVIAIALWCVPESRDDEAPAHVDWLGAVAATAALGMLTYGFITLQSPAAMAAGLTLVAAGILVFGAFVLIEARSRAPMIPPGIFSSLDFTIANIYTLLLYAALSGALFFVPFNLINVQGYTPLAAGAALLPMIALMFASSRWAGALAGRIGARIPLTAGAAFAALGFGAFAVTGVGGSYWTTFFPAVVLLGIGTSTFVAPLTTTVMNSAPAAHAGSASGINNAVSRVAGLLAIALLGIVVAVSTHWAVQRHDAGLPSSVRAVLEGASLLSGRAPDRDIPPASRPAAQEAVDRSYAVGFRDAMLACAALSLGASALALSFFASGRSVYKSPQET